MADDSTSNDTLYLECLLFVQDQSAGEWGIDVEKKDATKLAAFVRRQVNSRTEDLTTALRAVRPHVSKTDMSGDILAIIDKQLAH